MSTPHAGGPAPADFTHPETFEQQGDFSSYFRRMIPTLIAMVVIGWIFFTLVLNAIGLPVPALIAVVLALALGAWGYVFQKNRYEQVHAVATLTLSASGAEQTDGNTRVRLAWGDMETVAAGDMMGGLRATWGSDVARATGAAAAASMSRPGEAIWGQGSLDVRPDASALVRATVTQNLGGQDPSRARLGVLVTSFDPDWRHGRIGAWVAAYRPDLLG